MSLLDRVTQRATGERTSPVADAIIPPGATFRGFGDEEFSPEEYGDYIVTSNEIFSVVSLRARLMSGLKLRLYTSDDQDKEEITGGPAPDLFRNVNPFWTFKRLIRMDELSMSLWGESFWAVQKNRRGVPVELWWLKPSRVKVVPHDTNYIGGFIYEPISGGAPIPFTPDEIIWFRYPNPIEEFAALSPMAAARLSADTANAIQRSSRNLFQNGLQLGGVIVPDQDKVTFSQEQADELSRMLDRRWTGEQNANRWAVLRFEAQFKPINITPKDAETVAGMNLTLRQICNAYGVPMGLMNNMEGATLANLREFQQALWSNALQPDAEFRAAEIEEQLLPMFGRNGPKHCAFDFTRVPALQTANTEVWDRQRQAIEVGRSTINEIRALAGEPPLPWGDAYWAPVNKLPVTDATAPTVPAQEAEAAPMEETEQDSE